MLSYGGIGIPNFSSIIGHMIKKIQYERVDILIFCQPIYYLYIGRKFGKNISTIANILIKIYFILTCNAYSSKKIIRQFQHFFYSNKSFSTV